ncbi:polysaccharide deacetylase family protein [Deinococcus detaillensis]|uniref:Polysaccharide deacetylase family protein n=1 Tax=Deinococcus detaillensis TaxID=2592048 RepID=A0A553US56_9DEIO|nr:polysaccharide deacetylase family protein [Deinococcus detaillensis]TSA83059.1 polysaccharide deacetylase family protein [Deinococcus detaillensis]
MTRAALLALLLLSSAQAAALIHLRPSLNAAGIITHGPRTLKAGQPKQVALTFDADMTLGMESELRSGKVRSFDNEAVVQALEAANVPATFFLTGMWAQVYPASALALAKHPSFEIEDHSYDHPGFSQPCYGLASIADAQKSADIGRSQRAIQTATGTKPQYFRFPGGCASESDVQKVEAAGLTVVHWDVIGGDANQKSPAVIVSDVLSRVKSGSIVVLHVSGGHAPETGVALPAIIKGLRAEGYQLVTLKTLLGQP